MKNSDYVMGLTDIHGYTHDNSVAVLKKGTVLFAASEERYTRIKHDPTFPINSIKSGLEFIRLNPSKIGKIAVGYPKRKTFSVLKGKYFYEIIPFLFNILINRNFLLLKDFINIISMIINKSRKNTEQTFLKNKQVIYVDHHQSHAASGYYTSGFEKSIAVALDGFGSDLNGDIKSGAVFLCEDGEMKKVMSIPLFASFGLFYQSVTYMLDFTPGDGEGKTMGLAAYGDPKKVYSKLRIYCPTFKDGVWLPPKDWLASLLTSMPKVSHLFKSTDFGRFLNNLLKNYTREDLAAAAQKILEEELIKLISYLLKKYPDFEYFNFSGGVFLNVKANKKILELKGVKNIFVHPHAGDGGVAMGAAFAITPVSDLRKIARTPLLSAGLGQSYTDKQILNALKQYGNKITYRRRQDIVSHTVAQLLNKKVIGWFEGRAEWGPRALGFRSVLADPREPLVKDRINHVLKNREWFMPFAPSVLEEEGNRFFKNLTASPFMTIIFDVLSKKEKLIPAAIHIDNTARPNSVNKKNNFLYYKLLKAWYKKTNLPILLNTSFNRHGLPIVNSPKDAIDHLIMGAVDELIIGNYSVNNL